MSRTARFVSIGIAVVIAAVAIVLLRPDSGSEEADDPAPAGQQQAAESDPGGQGAAEEEPTATAESALPPPPVEIVVRDYEVRGGPKRIEVDKGETVRLLVKSDVADEVHVHGYDLYGDTAPGTPARFKFKAEFEGEFEIEGHQAADRGLNPLLARLVVKP